MDLLTILSRYHSELLSGLRVTFYLSVIVWLISFSLGSIIGWIAVRYSAYFGLAVRLLAVMLAGVPTVVFLFWIHYPVQSSIGVILDPLVTAVVALSLIGTFTVAETMRALLSGFPKHFALAGRVCGLTRKTIFLRIELPLLLRQLLPAYLLIAVSLLHMTLLSSLIGVTEVFRVAQRINSVIYRPVELYTGLSLFFCFISTPLFVVAFVLQAKFSRDLSER